MRREGATRHDGQKGGKKSRGKTRHTAHHDLGHPERLQDPLPPATPLKSMRPKSFPAMPKTRDFGFPAEIPALPDGYRRNTFMLMTRNPHDLFAYWEFTPDRLASRKAQMRDGQEYREVIRLCWPSHALFDVNFVFLPVSFDAGRSNLRVPHPGLSYWAEIGWLSSNGDFTPMLVSNESEPIERCKNALQAVGASDRFLPSTEIETGVSTPVNTEEE